MLLSCNRSVSKVKFFFTSSPIILISPSTACNALQLMAAHLCRLPHSNYLHRLPRVPHQTTPFTIDPSARSTQTFAERYGVSPPHSNENLYGNDYTIVGAHSDEKCSARDEKQARNQKVELPKTPSVSNIVQLTNNNNGGGEVEDCPQAPKPTVIKGLKNVPNNTHRTFDAEQRLQVSSFLPYFHPFDLQIVS